MSYVFSKVKVTTDYNWMGTEFFVGGIPREIDDLDGWTEFDNFLAALEDNECELKFDVNAYLYGDGEKVKASPEEVAYMCYRIANNSDFLNSRTDSIEDVQFSCQFNSYEQSNFNGLELE